MTMKKIIFRALLLLGGAMLGSCSEDLETNAFNISEKALQFSVDGGTQTLIIEVKCNCTLSCDADWIDYTPQYVEAGKNKLTITAAENPTLETREATIFLKNKALDIAHTIAVRQEGIAEENGVSANQIIIYTTTGNSQISINESAFDAPLSYHKYDPITRTGTLIFDRAVTKIGDRAFYECSSLTSIKIPDSVTGIGDSAFVRCSRLTSITIPNSVTEIGSGTFSGCSSLTSIAIPNGVTEIRESTFSECSGLTSIKIPDSVTEIGSWGFSGCSSLTSVTIGNSVTEIGESAFAGCSSLTSITIPNSVTEIGILAFYECSSLTSIKIPDSVTEIGGSAFAGCSSLTNITIPNRVTKIGNTAFYNCSSLTSVTIGNGVTEIGNSAFDQCSHLTSVYCKPKTPPTLEGHIYGSSITKIYVPTQSVAAYKAATGWSYYASMIVGYDF